MKHFLTLTFIVVCLFASQAAWSAEPATTPVARGLPAMPSTQPTPSLQVFAKIDLGAQKLSGGFITLGDLDNDGKVDLLVSRVGNKSTHLGLTALNLEGRILWQMGNPNARGGGGGEPPCRGYCLVYDIDGDGKNEVVVEITRQGKSEVCILDGATGTVKRGVPWPLGEKDGGSRPAPALVVARLDGPDAPPSLVVKYEASGRCPARAVALDAKLNVRSWLELRPNAIGHHATVFDVDGDGKDDIIFGECAVNHRGELLYDVDLGAHSDCTAVFRDRKGQTRILVSIDAKSACCLDAKGQTIWSLPTTEVSHGQGIWVGNFLPERDGLETIILKSGHYGVFGTYDAETGDKLGGFEHRGGIKDATGGRRYPDMPVPVRWGHGRDALWVPVDRAVVDGRGTVLADLGARDAEVAQALGAGAHKNQMAVQAIAVSLYDDDRDDLVLYQPVGGRPMVYIVGASDKAGKLKPYRHKPVVYNRKSYF